MRGALPAAGWAALLAFSALAVSCGRIGYDSIYDHVYVVTVFDDRQAGSDTMTAIDDLPAGIVGLSLREALIIAGNTPGRDLVTFDPRGLPAIIVTDSELPGMSSGGTVVDGSGAVTIDCSAVSGAALTVTADDVVVRGLRFEGCGGDAIEVTGSTAGVRIEDVTILDVGGRGIVAQECAGLSIVGLRIERAGDDLVSVTDCTDVTVRDAFMVIADKGAQRGVNFLRVTNSRIVSSIIDPGVARLINLVDSADVRVARNILDRGDAGVVVYGTSANITITQNIIIGSVYDGVYISGDATDTTVIHNTMLNCATPLADGGTGTIAANNLVSEDPAEFISPAPPAYDFTLPVGSPYIDAGEDIGFDGLPDDPADFYGAAPDLGAVESY